MNQKAALDQVNAVALRVSDSLVAAGHPDDATKIRHAVQEDGLTAQEWLLGVREALVVTRTVWESVGSDVATDAAATLTMAKRLAIELG